MKWKISETVLKKIKGTVFQLASYIQESMMNNYVEIPALFKEHKLSTVKMHITNEEVVLQSSSTITSIKSELEDIKQKWESLVRDSKFESTIVNLIELEVSIDNEHYTVKLEAKLGDGTRITQLAGKKIT